MLLVIAASDIQGLGRSNPHRADNTGGGGGLVRGLHWSSVSWGGRWSQTSFGRMWNFGWGSFLSTQENYHGFVTVRGKTFSFVSYNYWPQILWHVKTAFSGEGLGVYFTSDLFLMARQSWMQASRWLSGAEGSTRWDSGRCAVTKSGLNLWWHCFFSSSFVSDTQPVTFRMWRKVLFADACKMWPLELGGTGWVSFELWASCNKLVTCPHLTLQDSSPITYV